MIKAIAMKCSQEQFKKIEPKLEKLKHINIAFLSPWSNNMYLVNNLSGDAGCVSNVCTKIHGSISHGREVYETWDESKFLEACGFSFNLIKGKWYEDYAGNYIRYESTVKGKYHCDQWIEVGKEGSRYVNSGGATSIKSDVPVNMEIISKHLPDNHPDKITEFKKEAFEKQNNKTVMSKQKLTVPVTDVLAIHSIACTSWKSKIASDYLPRVNYDQNIEFTQTEVDFMFKSAIASQLLVLEGVFGKQSKPIDWNKIKTGSLVMIKHSGEHCGGIDAIDASKPVTVIFFNVPYMIAIKGRLLPNGAYSKYCTFEQDGKFVFFTSEDETYKNYIAEVVQY